jgi:hypothetical protein
MRFRLFSVCSAPKISVRDFGGMVSDVGDAGFASANDKARSLTPGLWMQIVPEISRS